MESRWKRLSLSVRYGQRHTRGFEAELESVTRSPLQVRSPRVHVPLRSSRVAPGCPKWNSQPIKPLQRTAPIPPVRRWATPRRRGLTPAAPRGHGTLGRPFGAAAERQNVRQQRRSFFGGCDEASGWAAWRWWGPRWSRRAGPLGVGAERRPADGAGATFASRLEVQSSFDGSDPRSRRIKVGGARVAIDGSVRAHRAAPGGLERRRCRRLSCRTRRCSRTAAGGGHGARVDLHFRVRSSCANIAVRRCR
jgi:hypothetical protein